MYMYFHPYVSRKYSPLWRFAFLSVCACVCVCVYTFCLGHGTCRLASIRQFPLHAGYNLHMYTTRRSFLLFTIAFSSGLARACSTHPCTKYLVYHSAMRTNKNASPVSVLLRY